MKKLLSLFLIIFITLSVFTGCKARKEKFTDYSFDYFDTVTTVIGFEKNKETFDANFKKINGWIKEYHQLYDIYSTYEGVTNIYNLNHSQGKEIAVDSRIIDLLLYAKDLNKKSKKLNIAMGSVLSIWHDYRSLALNDPTKALVPPDEILVSASRYTNLNDIIIDRKNGTVLIKDENLTLDVGAIAKGYTAQKVSEKMKASGMEGYILNMGGNVKIIGNRPDGKAWSIGIENPDTSSNQPYIETLSLNGDMSLVTSGSYQRFYTVQGKNYNHIINPDTLYPAEFFESVSVLCEDSALADGLSTILFCLPYEDGKKLVESLDNVHALWVTNEGEKLYSKGFKEYIAK